MKVTIIGGSQGTGARLAEAAVAAGHDVTVLSRSGGGPSGVTAVLGDATEPVAAITNAATWRPEGPV